MKKGRVEGRRKGGGKEKRGQKEEEGKWAGEGGYEGELTNTHISNTGLC